MNAPTVTPTTATLTAQLIAKRTKGIVNQAVWTLRIVIAIVALIVLAAMVANYGHQNAYLLDHVDALTAYIVPAALDLLTTMCAVILALPVIKTSSKWVALGGLVFAVGGSATLSFMAPGDTIGKIVAGGLVALIAVAEFVANHVHIDFGKMAAGETAMVTAVQPVTAAPSKPSRAKVKANVATAKTLAASSIGMSAKQLASATGVSVSTARKILVPASAQTRP
jgi:hypothetical protein